MPGNEKLLDSDPILKTSKAGTGAIGEDQGVLPVPSPLFDCSSPTLSPPLSYKESFSFDKEVHDAIDADCALLIELDRIADSKVRGNSAWMFSDKKNRLRRNKDIIVRSSSSPQSPPPRMNLDFGSFDELEPGLVMIMEETEPF